MQIERSNNRAVCSIKPFVIHLKCVLFFSKATNGTYGSAVLFSLIKTEKETNLDPYRYLPRVPKEVPKRNCSDSNCAQTLTPQNAPPDCR